MSQCEVPLDPDDILLRRIPEVQGFCDLRKSPPIDSGAFRPSPQDTDGLSFYLERETSAQNLVDDAERPDRGYLVARLRAGDIYDLGLSLVPSQLAGDLPGHYLLPKINTAVYADKRFYKDLKPYCEKLARLANQDYVDFSQPR